jgi:DNA repair exonuclease SbcCD ATPase subunit
MRLTQTTVDVQYVEQKFDEMLSSFDDEVSSATEEFGDKVGEVTDELDEAVGENGRMDGRFGDYLGNGGELESRLEDAFAEDGPFHERLNEELGEDGERIQNALDPEEDGTPINSLRNDIQKLRDLVKEKQGANSAIQRSTLKGVDFEETVGNILGDISDQTSDRYEFTGETVGEIPEAKVGDFVYELGGTGKRIVVEAKTEGYSLNDIETEMERAIENRDADYGVFVTDHLGNLPRTKVSWFHEFDRDFVTVALSETADEDIEPAFLRFALNWAQVRALHDVGAAGDEVDTTLIQSEVDAIDEKIDRFAQVRKQCTSIEDSVEEIRDELGDMESDIENRFETLRGELAGAN